MLTGEDLIVLSEAFASHTGLSAATISNKVARHARLFSRLRQGFGCTLDTADTAHRWFNENWPKDLQWPEGVPRPAKAKRAA